MSFYSVYNLKRYLEEKEEERKKRNTKAIGIALKIIFIILFILGIKEGQPLLTIGAILIAVICYFYYE